LGRSPSSTPLDYDRIDLGDALHIQRVREQIYAGSEIAIENRTTGHTYRCVHDLSTRQVELIVAGSIITFLQNRS
jgi:aconitate hydratase